LNGRERLIFSVIFRIAAAPDAGVALQALDVLSEVKNRVTRKKLEARNPKFETNSNVQKNTKFQTKAIRRFRFFEFESYLT